MKNVWKGSLLVVAVVCGVGCAKSATVKPDENAAAATPPPAEAPKEAAKPQKVEETVSAPKKVESPEAGAKLSDATIYFDFNSDTLSDTAREQLAAFVEIAKRTGLKATLVIEGHADERGTEEYNLALGDRRANTVRKYLQGLGINAKHLKTVSYGENRPAVSGEGEEAWSKNRRVQIVPPQMTSALQ